MCSKGKLCSALFCSGCLRSPLLGWCCALSSAATLTLSAQESGHQASALTASKSVWMLYLLQSLVSSDVGC